MSLAFELPKDKNWCENGAFQSFRLVSVWYMRKFDPEKIVDICSILAVLQQTIIVIDAADPSDELGLDEQIDQMFSYVAPFARAIESHLPTLKDLNLPVSVDAATRFLKSTNAKPNRPALGRLKTEANTLLFTIRSEITSKQALMIPSNRAEFYKKSGTILGSEIIEKFQEIEVDASEAGNCFALGRYTACAFHLMRIIEHMILEFATKLNINFDLNEDTSGAILGRIREKITKWDKGLQRPSLKKRKYFSCYESMAHLCSRRNDIMHIREHYTEERVGDLIGTVKTSIEDYLKLPEPPAIA